MPETSELLNLGHDPTAVGVRFSGGLGNQMFQYAYAHSLTLVAGGRPMFDCGWFRHPGSRPARRYGLPDFVCPVEQAGPDVLSVNMNWCERIGDHVSAARLEFKKLFALRDGYSPAAAAAHKRITAAYEPVAVHVRRGDYVGHPDVGVCDENYPLRAMRAMASAVPACSFFVFSDDISWCKDNLAGTGLPVTFIHGDWKETEELHLMASCRHHAIPNSTFAWWAAHLAEHPEQVVVCPDKWSNSVHHEHSRRPSLVKPGWLRLQAADAK